MVFMVMGGVWILWFLYDHPRGLSYQLNSYDSMIVRYHRCPRMPSLRLFRHFDLQRTLLGRIPRFRDLHRGIPAEDEHHRGRPQYASQDVRPGPVVQRALILTVVSPAQARRDKACITVATRSSYPAHLQTCLWKTKQDENQTNSAPHPPQKTRLRKAANLANCHAASRRWTRWPCCTPRKEAHVGDPLSDLKIQLRLACRLSPHAIVANRAGSTVHRTLHFGLVGTSWSRVSELTAAASMKRSSRRRMRPSSAPRRRPQSSSSSALRWRGPRPQIPPASRCRRSLWPSAFRLRWSHPIHRATVIA